MSLDDEDRRLIEQVVGAVKGRADFVEALGVLMTAICVAVQVFQQDPGEEQVGGRFSSVLGLAVSHLEHHLHDDAREQLHKIHTELQAMLKATLSAS